MSLNTGVKMINTDCDKEILGFAEALALRGKEQMQKLSSTIAIL
jgi:hypothetical protein